MHLEPELSKERSLCKSLQSCLTLCDPIDGRPPGSAVPGILQARILDWVPSSCLLFPITSIEYQWIQGRLKAEQVGCGELQGEVLGGQGSRNGFGPLKQPLPHGTLRALQLDPRLSEAPWEVP